ncbi:hypothetical protein [Proteiniborus sp. MB09-C3]|uniref:hypothetical protein n=1 Tax=Proteiniborus sp. MB09-C3 TaxID=3050072 RepID=UPI0025520F9B|nr:hypothetical protein [Proteiniborus sp. MB09-C3]WIV10581.1 hypothetical protein QO263_10470 [Proteiniborus sp. MB09-C3]
MIRKIKAVLLLVLIFTVMLTGCTSKSMSNAELENELKKRDTAISELEKDKKALEDRIKSLESELNVEDSDNLLVKVIEVIGLIKDKDMNGLSVYVHPTKGLRFTPYPYVDTQKDLVFTAGQVADIIKDTKVYTWGSYDGSGEPIKLSFNEYYDKFIYDEDFANPHMIGNNVAIGKGNTTDNIKEAYPEGYFVEFYFKGFESKYEGIDWRNLKLVFEEENGTWYLVGIVHGQWTI